MANPTGTTYLNASAGYVWTDGDVYQIPQTDLVEGAWPGASFGGQGVANQPHQLILDKLEQIRANQIADEATLAAMLTIAFQSGVGLNSAGVFTSGQAPNGWLKFTTNDAFYGQLQLMLQWGWISLAPWIELVEGSPSYPDPPNPFPFSFPIPFAQVALEVIPYWTSTSGFRTRVGIEMVAPIQLQNNQFIFSSAGMSLADTADLIGDEITGTGKQITGGGISGIGWFALGW